MRCLRVGVVGYFLLAVVGACSSGPSDSTNGTPTGKVLAKEGGACQTGDDCVVGLICAQDFTQVSAPSICAKTCSSSADCSGTTTCSTTPSGSRACLTPCASNNLAHRFVCDHGAFTTCDETTTPACALCGCTDPAAPVCDDTSGVCGPPRELGAKCFADQDCVSGRCGSNATCELVSGALCAGNEQYCGGYCGDSVIDQGARCYYNCSQGCDANSKCFSGIAVDYCAARCSNPGERCPRSPISGACMLFDNGDPKDAGPWCFEDR